MIRFVPARLAAVCAYMFFVVGLSTIPGSQAAQLGLPALLLNLAHIPLFAGLSWVTLWAFAGAARKRILLVVFACVVFAALDEWYQSFVPGRVSSVGDVGADLVGIVLGIVLKQTLGSKALAWKGDSNE